jgi:hypothetical protein
LSEDEKEGKEEEEESNSRRSESKTNKSDLSGKSGQMSEIRSNFRQLVGHLNRLIDVCLCISSALPLAMPHAALLIVHTFR